MRILPISTIDDTRTILQVVMRLQKYLEENPIRNIFYITEDYDENAVSYDVTKVKINSGLDVTISADDLLMFDNGFIAIVDSVGSQYVTIDPDTAQEFIGRTGNGITSITKTGTAGLVDTYTIAFTNGTTSTFTVTNGAAGAAGNGITSITKTGTAGLVDTYTITYTNGSTSTFTVSNGATGATGAPGNGIVSITKTGTAGLVDTYTITYTNGSTSTFTVTNGSNGTNGVGVPAGGTTGQVLKKKSNTDYDTEWSDESGGGGGSSSKNLIVGDNLIINPCFHINQRGFVTNQSLAASGYTVDRWYGESGGSYTYYSNHMTLGSTTKLHQYIKAEDYSLSRGKYLICGITFNPNDGTPTLKLSSKASNGSYFTELTPINSTPIIGGFSNNQLINIYNYDYGYLDFEITGGTIYNAFCYNAIEYDETSLSNTIIPVNVDDAIELEKCKYYYESINTYSNNMESIFISSVLESGSNATLGCASIIRFTKKRVNPTYDFSSKVFYIPYRNGSTVNNTASFSVDNNAGILTASSSIPITVASYIGGGRASIFGYLDAEIYP